MSVKDRMVPLKVHGNRPAEISIVMQNQDIYLKEVFQYILGALPWVYQMISVKHSVPFTITYAQAKKF